MLKKLFKKKTDLNELSPSTIDEIEEIEIEEELVADLKDEVKKLKDDDIKQHEKHFTDEKFWTKIQKFSKKAGTTVVYAVLLLYYTLQKPDVPKKAKATIIGALGYFILPLDIIPDLAAGVGYVDDLSALLFALLQIALYIDDEIKTQAKNKLKDLFGENIDTSEIDDKLGS